MAACKKCGCRLTIDSNVCNALSSGAGGLLVPQTDLVGVVASFPPIGVNRSVDIDVVETPGCPDLWTIGARMSPPSVQIENPALFALATTPASSGVWQPVPGFQVILPEIGCYDLSGEIGGSLSLTSAANGIILAARLFDVTNAVPLPISQRTIMQLNPGNLNAANPLSMQVTAPVGALHCIAAAPATVRVEAQVFWSSGTGATITAAQIFGGGRAIGTSTLRFHKYAD